MEKIPWEALQQSVKRAEKAFFKLKPDGPIDNYLSIKQASSESFVRFVEWLCQAINLQVPDEEVRRRSLTEMACQHANEQCKPVILSLPLDPTPTLPMMLEVCEKKVTILPTRALSGHQEELLLLTSLSLKYHLLCQPYHLDAFRDHLRGQTTDRLLKTNPVICIYKKDIRCPIVP